ncbi:hypothetical protein AB0C65_32005 [Nocardia sp. NPDC048505]|uniref:hypothetical protein n=1 Tax=Nocardia sp. NPDC048505 TaxID=3155756 RepID=UPI0033F0E0A4
MSDSFLLATRIPMSRKEFEQWLDTAAPEVAVVENPEAMFEGRFWDGQPARWQQAEVGVTAREYFAESAGDPYSTCVLVHRDGALEAYLMYFGFREPDIYTALLLFAAAGQVAAAPATVLFWAETSGVLGTADWDGWLATLAVGPARARFSPDLDLVGVVDALRPVEERFFELVELLAEAEEAEQESAAVAPRFLDPAILA